MSTRRSTSSEAGFTLIELLVAMVVTAIAVLGILGALGTSIMSSALQQNHATGEALLRTFAEHVKAVPYQECPANYGVLESNDVPDGYVLEVMPVEYWDGVDGNYPLTFTETCGSDHGLQRLTITVEKPDATPRLELVIMKRDDG